MGEESVSTNFDHLQRDLAELQSRWERKLTSPGQHKLRIWALGVLFGIETGRAKIKEGNWKSLGELDTLLVEWEGIRAHADATLVGARLAKVTIRGLDFGIRLVIGRVRCSLNRGLDEN